MKSIKILFVSPNFSSNIGGIEKVVFDLKNGLNRKGFKCFEIVPSKNFLIFFKKFFSINPDIVHSHGFRFYTPMVWIACKIKKIPFVLTPHFDYDLKTFHQKLNFLIHKLFKPSLLIALTKNEKNILNSLGFNSVKIIPNGVNLNEFKPLKSNFFRKKFKIPLNAFLVLFVGRFAANKGLPFLIKSFTKLSNEKFFLAIIGKEDLRFQDTTKNFLKKLINQNNLTNVVIAGELSQKQLILALNECNCLVFPSTSNEAFGLTIIQAMACKKPVIASALNSVKEIISHNENGLLFSPNNEKELLNALNQLQSNNELREKIALKGFETVKKKI
jgi:glycosyltransferase involved in cell wall biosynthesis